MRRLERGGLSSSSDKEPSYHALSRSVPELWQVSANSPGESLLLDTPRDNARLVGPAGTRPRAAMDLGGVIMYVTTRHYSGLDRSSLDEIVRRREEIETFVKGRPGLRGWYA